VGIAPAAGVSTLKNIAGEVGSFTNLSKYLPEWMAGGADAGARERAAKALQDASQNPQAAADAVWNRPAPSPGTQPTLGETAGDERLAAFQRLHTDSESGILPNQVTNAQARNQTVKDVIGGTDAQTVQDLAARQSAANEATLAARKAQGQNALDTLQAQHEAAVAAQQQAGVSAVQGVTDSGNAALDAATQAVGSPLSREESSVWSRAKYKANLLAATLKTRAAYRAPELTNPTPIPVDADQAKSIFGDLTAKADAFYGDAGGDAPGKVQSAVHDILDAIGGDNLNTKSVANVDRRLADFASTKRVAGATKEAAFAESLRGTLSDHLDPFIPQETKDALATASAARAEQAQIFEQGRIGALFRPKKFGEDRVSDSELAGRLVTTGDAGGTLGLQLKNALGPDAAEQLVSEHMRRMADLGKLNTSSGFNAYDALLSHFPDVQARIQAMRAQAATNVTDIAGQRAANVSNVADLVAANKRNFAQQRDAISANTDAQAASNRAFNASPLGGLRDPTQVDPSVAIGQMLSSPHGGPQMETLVNQLKDSPTAMDGARKALADHVDRLATKGANFDSNGLPIPKVNPSIAALDDVLKNHAGLLNDDQVQALTGVQNELKAANFANTGGKILPKPITDKTIPANAIVARTIRFLTARFNNEDRVNELIRAAIVDPEVGKNMLLRSTPDRLGNVMRRVRSATAAAAVGTAVQQYPGLTGTVTDTSPAQPAQ
jgi:hypothetical protein